jgi:hypothetical protein
MALVSLRQLPEDAFDQLVADLERSPMTVPTVRNLSVDDSEAIFDAITSLHRVRAYTEVPIDEFIGDLCESLYEHNSLPHAEEPTFRERLSRILDIEALTIAGKAVALHTEHENLFCSARIMTDARPIFANDPSSPPAAMIINHTLKIDYHTGAGGRIEDFYIALGSKDIEELKSVLARAELKAKSLATVIAKANTPLIDPQQ